MVPLPLWSSDAFIEGDYRYRLTRMWGHQSLLTWVMLNPSTADHAADDPTIRRVMRFSEREGYGGCQVVNLYALRATDPTALTSHDDPSGPRNLAVLRDAMRDAPGVVVAWGAHPMARRFAAHIRRWRPDALCLGLTKGGSPKHPLYIRADQPMVPAWPALTAPLPDGDSDA